MQVKYKYTSHFLDSLHQMNRSGGRTRKAAEQVFKLIARINIAEEDPFHGLRKTRWGENRIKNCIKYDLTDFARLVTIKTKGLHCLIYVGQHGDEDKWIERNKGIQLAVNELREFEMVRKTSVVDYPEAKVSNVPDNFDGKLLDRLEVEYRHHLIGDIASRFVEPLRELKAGSSTAAIEFAVRDISDLELRQTTVDVLMHLNAGDTDEAKRVIDLHRGELSVVEDIPDEMLLKVQDGARIKAIPIGSKEYLDWLKHFMNSSNYFDWLLFMHPEQEKFVETDYSGPTKLSGVSGSGKTCIAVRRSIRLAKKYPTDKVLLLTLNRSLSNLISELTDHACPDTGIRNRIEVTSFFALCQNLLNKFEPGNEKLYSDVSWKLEEHIDEIFREFYRCENNVSDAEVILPLHWSLMSQNVMAEDYIRDEFDWIRSACGTETRTEYLEMERRGRGYPIDTRFRKMLLEGLQAWTKKMTDIGIIDYLGLSAAVQAHSERIKAEYRCVVVDEVQDFGSTELAIIRKLVNEQENDLFLCGDLAQHILPKHQHFAAAGIDVGVRSNTIRRNYRNSKEILRAAYDVLIENLEEHLLDGGELEILDPEYASRSSAVPTVLQGDSLNHEIAAAFKLMEEQETSVNDPENAGNSHKGCIVLAGYSLYEIANFGKILDIPVLDGNEGSVHASIVLSDLEQTKGYEFDTVAILNCTESVLPPVDAPEDEAFRHGCQLYVAMTRAKHDLYLSYSGNPSKWLLKADDSLLFGEWKNYIHVTESDFRGRPGHLPEVIDAVGFDNELLKLTGRQFLYTSYSRGLTRDTQKALDTNIDGRGLSPAGTSGYRTKWASIGQLSEDMERAAKIGRAGYSFGPAADKEVYRCLQSVITGKQYIVRKKRHSK